MSFMKYGKLKKVHDATAAGLTELLKDTMAEMQATKALLHSY